MTKAQENAINRIRTMVDEFNGEHEEIKEWEVLPLDYSDTIFLSVTCGYKNDERSLKVLFRNHFCLFIGVRGGIWYYPDGRRTRKHFTKSRIWSVIYDQSHHDKKKAV